MNQSYSRRRFAIFLLIFAILAFMVSPAASAKGKKKKSKNRKNVVYKKGSEQKAIMFSQVQKRFVVTRKTSKENIQKIGMIENAGFIIDGEGKFPAKSLLLKTSSTGHPLNLVLPLKFTTAHTRRLSILQDYSVTFKISAETFTDKVVNRALSLGPRTKTFEFAPADLSKDFVALFKKVRHFETRIVVPEGSPALTKKQIKLLKNKIFLGVKEIILPPDYPVKAVAKLKRVKRLRIILDIHGTKANQDLLDSVNKLKKTDAGARIRGLIKEEESFNYMMFTNLQKITMSVEDWKVTDSFIAIMNSKGDMQAKR